MQMTGGYAPTLNPNKKLYNAGSEWQDDIEGLADYYSTFFRGYDPVIGRFNGVDPKSESFESWTTYHYSYNNPVNFNDPMGDKAEPTLSAQMRKEYLEWHDPQYGNGYFYGSWDWDFSGGGGGITESEFWSTYRGMQRRLHNDPNTEYYSNKWGEFGYNVEFNNYGDPGTEVIVGTRWVTIGGAGQGLRSPFGGLGLMQTGDGNGLHDDDFHASGNSENGEAYLSKIWGRYSGKYGTISGDVRFAGASYHLAPWNNNSNITMFDGGVEAAAVRANLSLQLGSDKNNFTIAATGSLFSVSANAKTGIYNGENGMYGVFSDINAGAYVAQGDITMSGTIAGVKYSYTQGASVVSAHAGATGGVIYNGNTGVLTISGGFNIGWGIGLKEGITLEIPIGR